MEVASLSSLPVGVLFWNSPEPCLTVLTKMTLSLGESGAQLATTQEPLRGPTASPFDCAEELYHPGDFAPHKARCDVMLTGCAYADVPSLIIGARVKVGAMERRFFALASERSEAIPLSRLYLRRSPSPDVAQVTVGPLSALHPDRHPFSAIQIDGAAALEHVALPADFDFGFYNAAPFEQQIAAISPGMPIALHGLMPDASTFRGQIPSMWPRIFLADERRGGGLREIQLVCDTLWIDTDRALCELTFRGTLALGHRDHLPARLVATLSDAFERPDLARIEARMGLAAIRPVIRAADVEGGFEPEQLEPVPSEPEEPEEIEPEEDEADEPERATDRPPSFAPGATSGSPSRASMHDDATQLHTDLPSRTATLPFSERRPPATAEVPPERNPALGALPAGAAALRKSVTLNLPPEQNPALSALPFGAPGPRRAVTLDLPPEKNPALAALPFGAPGPRRAVTLDPSAMGPAREVLPFAAAPAPVSPSASAPIVFGAPPGSAPAPRSAPAAPPVFGMPPPAPVPAFREPETLAPPRFSAGDTMPPEPLLPPPPVAGRFADTGASPSEVRGAVDMGAELDPDTLVPPPPGAAGPDTLVPPPPVIPPAPVLPGRVVLPGPMDSPTTMGMGHGDPRVPPPWAQGLASRTGNDLAGAGRLPARPLDKLGLLPLDKDAAIHVALWEGAAPLHETLAKHGLDELTWREHRRLREKELREEAESGGNAKALAAHEALENARRPPPEKGVPALDLAMYAQVRAALEGAADEPAVLAARGIELARWEQDHRWYRAQLRKDPALAERFRAALEAEKITLGRPAPPSPRGPRRSPQRPRGAAGKMKKVTPEPASPR